MCGRLRYHVRYANSKTGCLGTPNSRSWPYGRTSSRARLTEAGSPAASMTICGATPPAASATAAGTSSPAASIAWSAPKRRPAARRASIRSRPITVPAPMRRSIRSNSRPMPPCPTTTTVAPATSRSLLQPEITVPSGCATASRSAGTPSGTRSRPSMPIAKRSAMPTCGDGVASTRSPGSNGKTVLPRYSTSSTTPITSWPLWPGFSG